MALNRKTPVRAVVLGIRTAQETRVLATYNSAMYSVLIAYNDGSRELLELDAKGLSKYIYLIPM